LPNPSAPVGFALGVAVLSILISIVRVPFRLLPLQMQKIQIYCTTFLHKMQDFFKNIAKTCGKHLSHRQKTETSFVYYQHIVSKPFYVHIEFIYLV
jgi:hypothetical protein